MRCRHAHFTLHANQIWLTTATPLSVTHTHLPVRPRTGGFASPSFDGYALGRRWQCACGMSYDIYGKPVSI